MSALLRGNRMSRIEVYELSKPYSIIILGANGSGKSTLGRELARVLNFAHFDVEDYWFYKTDIPYLTAPIEIRMKRIDHREYARWGDRVCEGGDMYESQKRFREFAATRNVDLFEQVLLKYLCPVLRIDGTQEVYETIRLITQQYCTIPAMNIAIRAAVEKDAAALNRLNTVFNGVGNITEEVIAHSILNNDREQVFVAECDNTLVGFCCVQLFKSFCYDSNYAEITELFVDWNSTAERALQLDL
jgi:energy-coupling factor transporter ATP-binding protein EcfA2